MNAEKQPLPIFTTSIHSFTSSSLPRTLYILPLSSSLGIIFGLALLLLLLLLLLSLPPSTLPLSRPTVYTLLAVLQPCLASLLKTFVSSFAKSRLLVSFDLPGRVILFCIILIGGAI